MLDFPFGDGENPHFLLVVGFTETQRDGRAGIADPPVFIGGLGAVQMPEGDVVERGGEVPRGDGSESADVNVPLAV